MMINGHGEIMISEKVIMKEHIIKYVCKNLNNFQYFISIKNLFILVILGNFNTRICCYKMIVKEN
jgi:hypothetical protein